VKPDESATRAAARLLEPLADVGPSGAIDIAVVAVFLYAALRWMQRSGATSALRGVLVIGAVYLLARQFTLSLTSAVLEGLFLALLFAVIVIYRDELRRFVERVAEWSRAGLGSRRRAEGRDERAARILAHVLTDLARQRVGAIVVVEGRAPVEGLLQGGVALGGELSEPLLRSIFDPSSMGHDGALLVRHGKVERFMCHLPLSTNYDELGHRGTRHAAALGLSERSDALCLVVSEERGEVSVAREGKLRACGADELAVARALEAFFGGPGAPPSRAREGIHGRTVAAAVAMSVLLWLVLAHGARPTVESYVVPVEHLGVPAGLEVASVTPAEVTLTFSGARRDFYFVARKSFSVVVRLDRAGAGTRNVAITTADVGAPRGVTLRGVEPAQVAVEVRATVAPEPASSH
jgi:uncharacterized protein (TIGR00159 family)